MSNEQTMTTSAVDTMREIFGEPIHTYTRAQALADGVLVDLMQDEMAGVARQHFKHPIACTAAVWDIITRAVENPNYHNDYAGVLHDILWMCRKMGKPIDETAMRFPVVIVGAGRRRLYEFKMQVGPGDAAEPVMTLMLSTED